MSGAQALIDGGFTLSTCLAVADDAEAARAIVEQLTLAMVTPAQLSLRADELTRTLDEWDAESAAIFDGAVDVDVRLSRQRVALSCRAGLAAIVAGIAVAVARLPGCAAIVDADASVDSDADTVQAEMYATPEAPTGHPCRCCGREHWGRGSAPCLACRATLGKLETAGAARALHAATVARTIAAGSYGFAVEEGRGVTAHARAKTGIPNAASGAATLAGRRAPPACEPPPSVPGHVGSPGEPSSFGGEPRQGRGGGAEPPRGGAERPPGLATIERSPREGAATEDFREPRSGVVLVWGSPTSDSSGPPFIAAGGDVGPGSSLSYSWWKPIPSGELHPSPLPNHRGFVPTYRTPEGRPYVFAGCSKLNANAWRLQVLDELRWWEENERAQFTGSRIGRRGFERFKRCGSWARVPVCAACGKADHRLMAYTSGPARRIWCGLRICEICEKRAAALRGLRLRAAFAKLRESRPSGYRLRHLVLEPRFDAADPSSFTPRRLRDRIKETNAAWAYLWQECGLRVPKRGRTDRALVRHPEITETGFVHAHALFWGPFVDVQVLERRLQQRFPTMRLTLRPAYWRDEHGNKVEVTDLADDDARLPEIEREAVLEAVKCAVKAQSPDSVAPDRARRRVHPRLAAAFEIACTRLRMWEPYGALRGLQLEAADLAAASLGAEDAVEVDASDVRDADGDLSQVACPSCGVIGELAFRCYPMSDYLRIMRKDGVHWRDRRKRRAKEGDTS